MTHRRGSRASLVWFLAGFVGLQLGLAVAIEVWLPQLRDPLYVFKAMRLRQRSFGAPIRPLEVVMVGSSRTAFGLQGVRLEDRLSRALDRPVVAFNFGIFGIGPVRELLLVKRLLGQKIHPDLLLVEVLPPLLAGQEQAPAEWSWIIPSQLWLKELPSLSRYGLPVAQYRRRWWQGWPLPWFTHRFEILSCVAPGWVPLQYRQDWSRGTDRCGWAPNLIRNRTHADFQQALERARNEYASFLTGFQLGGPSSLALRDLLELCRSEGIPVALVLMPEGTGFRAVYSPAIWAQIQNHLAALQREFTVPLINAREWLPDDAFSDGHHLLPEGAAVFSERLGGEVLRVLPGTAEPLLERCRERIEQRARPEEQANLLAVSQVLAKLRFHDPDLLALLGGKRVMIESPLIQEIIAERFHEAITKLLRKRFRAVPSDVTKLLHVIVDEKRLTDLLLLAAECPNLETFREQLSG